MTRQTLKRLIVKGTMAYVAVFSLVLMVAMPAMAVMAARNSVNRRSIINGEVTYRDLAKNSVRTGKIAPKAVRYGKIASGAVRTNHIKDGHVKSADIGNGQVGNADLANNAVNSAKIQDGQVGSADISDGSITNADIANGAAIADAKINYSTKIGYLSIPVAALTHENGSAYSRSSTLMGSGNFSAPVNLPHGAVVTSFHYRHYDNHGTYSTSSILYMVATANSVGYAMTSLLPSGNASFWQTGSDYSIASATIDNLNNAYYVKVSLTGNHTSLKAGNILIRYTYTSPGS